MANKKPEGGKSGSGLDYRQKHEGKTEAEIALPSEPNFAQEKLDSESRADPQAPRNGDYVSVEI